MTDGLSFDTRLSPNTAEVAAKVMDGEAILINLADGMYFSMDQAGGLMWELVEGRASLADIAKAIASRYDVDADRAAEDVRRVAVELLDAQLVLIDDAPALAAGAVAPLDPRLPYESPRLISYSDMAELLALDPPHPGLADTLSKPLAGD